MAKKRRTRQEKIFQQLKKNVHLKQSNDVEKRYEFTPSQDAVSSFERKAEIKSAATKKADMSVFSYDPRTVKKDLLKTFLLTVLIVAIQVMLYLKLK
jgi:hypothetical protein